MAPTMTKMTPLFQVFDMRTSVAFYRDKLGFEVAGTYEPDGHLYWAELKLGDIVLMLNACWEDDERPDQPDESRNKGHGDTALYFQCSDIDTLYQQLRDREVEVQPPSEQHGRREVVVIDPDGYHLSFYI